MTVKDKDDLKKQSSPIALIILGAGLAACAGLLYYTTILSGDPGQKLSAPVLQSQAGMDEAAIERTAMLPQKYPNQSMTGSYLSARFAQRHHDWKNAGEYIEYVMDHTSYDPTLTKRAMVLAMGAGETERAMELAQQIIETDETESSLAHMFLATQAFKNKDYNDAATQIQRMPEGGLADFIMPLLYSWSSAAMDKFDTAHLSGNSIHLYHAILIADFMNQNQQIEKLLEQAINGHELMPEDVERIADIYAYLGETEQAEMLYREIIQIDESNQSVAEKIKKIENGEKPEDIFVRIKTPENGVAEAMYDMARLLAQDFSDESARVFARLALYLNPNLTKSKLLLARIAARNEQYNEAITFLQSVRRDDPSYLAARRSAAELLQQQERYDEALAELNTLVDEYKDVDALIQIGDIHRINEDFPKAIKTYNRAEKILGTIPDKYWHIYYFRGMSYEQDKQWEKAEADLQKALEFRPEHPYVLNYLGYAWADQGVNLENSLNMIEKAVNLRPGDGYITDSLGWVYYRMGRYKEAVPHLEQAVELMPYDPVINDHLGDAYWQVGRKLEARFQWRRAKNHAEDEELIDTIDQKLLSGVQNDNGLKKADADQKKTIDEPPATSQAAIDRPADKSESTVR